MVRGSETAVTQAATPRAGIRSQGTTSTFGSTPSEVLYANELMRGRMWVAVCVFLGLGGVGVAILIHSPGPLARQLLGVASGALAIISGFALWYLRKDGRYTGGLAALYGYTCLAAILPALHFFGWFSAVNLLIALGGVIYAMGHTNRAVWTFAASTIAAHATLAGLTIAGTIPDRGVAGVELDGLPTQLVAVAMCEFMFALSFVVGRILRRQTLVGVESYGLAIEENTRREALLQEAQDELRRARKIGEAGRFTGLELGSYTLGVVLGRGGMGEVYGATHSATGAAAAVKVMSATGTFDQRARQRFEREIDLAASLESRHIVRVLEHSVRGDSMMYLAMERLEGAVLADELRTVKRPPRDAMLAMLHEIAEGISVAHGAGVVHRDLTPRNIFHHRDENGEDVWKILDFGVSKLASSAHTLTGDAMVGTPAYMSPEQAGGEDIDHRSDLFTLGCVAYRCLTGRPPFRGETLADVVYKVVNEMPLRPSRVAPVPPEVDLVLAIALAKESEHRFESARELVAALEDACDGHIDEHLERRGAALVALHPWQDAPTQKFTRFSSLE